MIFPLHSRWASWLTATVNREPDLFDFDFSAPAPVLPPKRRVYRVAEITRRISSVLEDEVGIVWVEGEISNLRRPASAHLYFTLKDDTAQIGAVLFRGNQRGLDFALKDGMQIRVQGGLTVFAPQGRYQINVVRAEPAGEGALQQQFEILKKKLAAEGLFEADRKRPLPLLPRHIGIVTSATGAAIRDILTVLNRRFPNLHIVLAPAKVQGEGAAREIVRGIERLNARADIEVLIVGRGGGSLEDLWAFNEEAVARAVAASRLPVISAVGHEIDFTICDFVADWRAPTPSAAAEQVVAPKAEFEERLVNLQRRMARALERRLLELRQRLAACRGSYVFQEPTQWVRQHRQKLVAVDREMRHHLQQRARQKQQQVDEAGLRMGHCAVLVVQKRRQQLDALARHLRALNPLAVLQRGYSVTLTESGQLLRDAEAVTKGERLRTRLARGQVLSSVEEIEKGSPHGDE